MRPRFVAVRKDGLGARMAAVLNAMVLAEHFGGTFQFAWSLNDSLDDSVTAALLPAEKMFTDRFIERFQNNKLHDRFDSGEGSSPAQRNFVAHKLTNAKIVKLIAGKPSEHECWVADLDDLAGAMGYEASRKLYANAFERIEFVPTIEKAIRLARALDVPANACALHLRGGDIITRIRFGNRFTPLAVPFQIVEEIGHRLRTEGRKLFVFGQERDVVAHVAASADGIPVYHLVEEHGLSPIQAWFYETTVMTLCDTIVSGTSSFARVPSWIGGTKVQNGYAAVSGADVLSMTLGGAVEQAPVPDLNKAFAFWATQEVYRDELSIAARIYCVDGAIRHDPVNSFYRLARATLLTEAGRTDAAQADLRVLVDAETVSLAWHEGCLRQVLANLRGQARDTATRYLIGIDRLAALDLPEAILCKILLATDRTGTEHLATRFKQIEGDTPRARFYSVAIASAIDRYR